MSSGNSEGGDVTRINTAIIASVIAALKTNQEPISNASIGNASIGNVSIGIVPNAPIDNVPNAPIDNAVPHTNLDNILDHMPYLGFIDFEDRLFQLLKTSLTDRINELVKTSTTIMGEKKNIMDDASNKLSVTKETKETAEIENTNAQEEINRIKSEYDTTGPGGKGLLAEQYDNAKKKGKLTQKNLLDSTNAYTNAVAAYEKSTGVHNNASDAFFYAKYKLNEIQGISNKLDFYKIDFQFWLLGVDTTEKQVYANMSTIDKMKNRQTSYTDTYLKYFTAYAGRQKIYNDAVRVETIDRARFEEFAFIDHHDEYDRSIMGKQSGGKKTRSQHITNMTTDIVDAIKPGATRLKNQLITTARNAIPSVGRRIGDIRKAESNGAVYYSGKTNVRDVIRLDNFNFTRYCNGYVWFLAAWIYSPELGYFHLKDLDIRQPNSVNPRFFWNFTNEMKQKDGQSIKTFRYFNTSNVLIGDKKDDKIQLYETDVSTKQINTDGNGNKIYKPVSLLKDEYLNEIGVPKTEDNTQLISDINQKCTVLSRGSFDSTFSDANSLFDWNIPDSVYYPEKYKFDTKITPDLGVPYFMMGCLTPDKDVIFYPHLDRGQYLFFMSKDDYMKEMDYIDKHGAAEEEARRKAAEEEARRKAATKTITNFLIEKIKAIKSRKRAEEEARRKADEDKKTAAIVAAIEKRKQEAAEQLDAARKKAEEHRRRKQEEEERRRREQEEDARNKIAAIVAVDKKRKQEAEADAERRRKILEENMASIIRENIKKFLEKRKEARQREEKRKREEEEERKKTAAAAAAIEQERLHREQERERLEKERLERERLEKERLERERLEKERLERERLERERLERLEKERLERLEKERQEAERRRKEEEERKILAAILAAISQTQTVAKNPQTIFDFIDVVFVGNTEIIKKAVNDIRDILKYHFIYKQLNSYYITLIPDNNKTNIASNMNNIRKIRDGIKNETIVKIDDVNKSYDDAKKPYNELRDQTTPASIEQQNKYFKSITEYQNYIISFIEKYIKITNFFNNNNTISLVNINNVDDILSNIKDNSNDLYPLLKDLLNLETEIKDDIETTNTNIETTDTKKKNKNVTNTIKDSIDALGKRLTNRNTSNRIEYKGNYLNRRLNILRDIYSLFSEKNKVFIEKVGNNRKEPGWIFDGQARGKQIKEFLPYISHGWFTDFFELMTGKIDTNIKFLLNTFDEYEKDNLNKNNIKKIDTHSGIEKSIQENLDKLDKININTESGITEYITVINKTKQDIFLKIQSGCDRYIIKTEESDKIIQDIHEITKSVKEFAVGKPNLGTGYNDTNYQTTSHVFSHFEKQPAQNTNLNDELKTQGFISFIPSISNDYPLEMGQYLEHVYQQYDNTNTVTDTHYLYLIPKIREQLLKSNKTNNKIKSQISSRFSKKNIENTTSDKIIIGNDDYDDQIGTYKNDRLFDLELICSEIEQGIANPVAGKDIKDDVLITGRRPLK